MKIPILLLATAFLVAGSRALPAGATDADESAEQLWIQLRDTHASAQGFEIAGGGLVQFFDGVATIEMIGNIENTEAVDGAVGTLKSGEREWPAFALAADFRPRNELPSSYKYCVAINNENQAAAFSLACEEVGTIALGGDLQVKPLQACMRTAGNPIDAVLIKDGKVMLVGDIAGLQQYLVTEEAA